LAVSNEPAEMVLANLRALRALDYPNFEVIVVDNNTKDAALWQPVAAWCAMQRPVQVAQGAIAGAAAHEITQAPQFRFFHYAELAGFKAGALNAALRHTAHDAEWIAVLDADYQVAPNWLSTIAPMLADPTLAIVQCPQAHRDYAHRAFSRACNYEYDGFFRIGMHARNEHNAIIMHGTMVVLNKRAVQQVGGWGEWCLCEDTELGLRLLQAGWQSVYLDQVLGTGLVPENLRAFQKQRFRWAFGAMQILRQHFGALVWNPGRLTRAQRLSFLTGWLHWWSEGLQLVFVGMSLIWTALMLIAPRQFEAPLELLLVPVVSLLVVRTLIGFAGYRSRCVARGAGESGVVVIDCARYRSGLTGSRAASV
jgi:cellulose synthase/poly-beta-1,6-N-acetylglucosamine synthase-like glycosyltransferase